MKRYTINVFSLSILLILMLTACGGGAATEVPAAETPKQVPTNIPSPLETWPENRHPNAGVAVLNDLYKNIEENCEEGDYFVQRIRPNPNIQAIPKNIFLKLKENLKVCNPETGRSVFVADICTAIFNGPKVWNSHMTFAENFGEKLSAGELESVNDGRVEPIIMECPDDNTPTEYYRCADNIYIYRDISGKAECIEGVLQYHVDFEITDEQCLPEDYTYIERWTDGYNYFELDPRADAPGTQLFKKYTERVPALIMTHNNEDDYICNPFVGQKLRMSPQDVCETPLELIRSSQGEVSRVGYCVEDSNIMMNSYKIETKVYTCKAAPDKESPDKLIEIIVLDPYTEEESQGISWQCKGANSVDFADITIEDLYYRFDEECKGYYTYEPFISHIFPLVQGTEMCCPKNGVVMEVRDCVDAFDMDYSEYFDYFSDKRCDMNGKIVL
ncbi:MAG: hypothetical protein KKF44_04710, partial [Nanoarchaeota archaeon]|nr:hypothetical protein [Nanoarchaeota archaeon]